MKFSGKCSKCGSVRLWVIETVGVGNGSPNRRDLPVTVAYIPPGDVPFWSLRFSDVSKYVEVGTFEAWVCANCGFTEWYAKDVNDTLAELAKHPETGIRLVDASNSQGTRGPFR